MRQKSLIYVFTLVLLSISLVACGGGESEENEESGSTNEVVIGVYGGDWETNIREAGLDQFEEETGINVTVVSGADAEWYSKLRAADGVDPIYDVLILQPDTIERAVAADLLEPLDQEKLPNLEHFYPTVHESLTFDDTLYAAGFSVGQLGIAYRGDLLETAPTKWLDLWNPEYKGQVGISSPSYAAGLQFFSGIVQALGGEESNPEDIDYTFEKLSELAENTTSYPDNPGAIQTLLERGEAAIIPFWDGRTFGLQEAGLDVEFVYPEDGPVAAIASWVITKGSPNLENAYELVNFLSTAEVQGNFAETSFYGMTNSEVEYSEALESKVQVSEEFLQEMNMVDYETVTPMLNELTDRWTSTFGAAQ